MTTAENSTSGPAEQTGRHEGNGKYDALDRLGIARLVRTNLPAQVISPVNLVARFGERGEKFTPSLYQPIQTVRVRTADGDIVELIRDGHHRAKYLADNYDVLIGTPEVPGNHPDFKITIQDATDEVLAMFSETQRGKGPSTLTMAQYWMDVIPYTHAHAEVEDKRTISHLITGWSNHVGRHLADKYSAFAALCVLTDDKRYRKKGGVQEYLEEYFAAEPDKERLISGLLDTDRVLAEAHVGHDSARKEAALLVSVDADNVGGEEMGKQQIIGLLGLPPVQVKLLDSEFNLEGQLTSAFDQAGKRITNLIDDIFTVLAEPAYSRGIISTILTAKNPASKKKEIDHEISSMKRQEEYCAHVRKGRDSLSEIERVLVSRGSHLPDYLIQRADELATTARRRMRELPPESSQWREIKICLTNLTKVTGAQVADAVKKLDGAIADSVLHDSGQRPGEPGQRTADSQELLFLRGAARELQERLRRMTAERDLLLAENSRVETQNTDLRELLASAGIVYQEESPVDPAVPDDAN